MAFAVLLALGGLTGCDKPPASGQASAIDARSAVPAPRSPAPPGGPRAEVGAPGTAAREQHPAPASPLEAPATGVPGAAPQAPAKSDKQREPLFQNWPQPRLVLFLTGQQHGYIEPCGCSGLANQKGGLARRYTLHKSLVQRGWEVVALDAGNQVSRFGRQAEIKFQITAAALKQMGYGAIGLGPDDLRLSVGELIALTAAEPGKPSLFVSANTAVIDRALIPQYQVLAVAGKRIGVTAVLAADQQAKILSDEILKTPPEPALREVWAQLERERCDVYVLLTQASVEETRRLAQQVPGFDLVVSADEIGEPTHSLEPIPGTKSQLVQVGHKSMYVPVVGLFDTEPRWRYQRVPLDDRFADSPEMLELLASYQEQLQTAGLEGLEVKTLPHPSGRQFVGSQACAECHEEEDAIWKKTGHAHALQTLMHPGERSEIPRHFDPECIACHVVGWNPQKHFPYESGYLGVAETPLRHHVGCENCHGPGSAHVAAENDDSGKVTDTQLEKLRAEVRLPLEEAERKCMECHDIDNSPDFHAEGAFERYWEKVKH